MGEGTNRARDGLSDGPEREEPRMMLRSLCRHGLGKAPSCGEASEGQFWLGCLWVGISIKTDGELIRGASDALGKLDGVCKESA